jgi:WD40 repeat protein
VKRSFENLVFVKQLVRRYEPLSFWMRLEVKKLDMRKSIMNKVVRIGSLGVIAGVMLGAFGCGAKKVVGGVTAKPAKRFVVQKTLIGHSKMVTCAKFSPDGKTLVSSGMDCTIRLWDVATGKLKSVDKRPKAPVNWVDFSPDGKLVVNILDDNTVGFTNVEHQFSKVVAEGDGTVGWSVAVSPDSLTLMASGENQCLRFWDLWTGRLKKFFITEPDNTNSATFSPDGTYVAAGSDNSSTIKVWDVYTGKIKYAFKGHTEPNLSVVFAPDGKTLVSGGLDRTIKFWDLTTGKLKRDINTLEYPVTAVSYSRDGSMIASGDMKGDIRIWDAVTGKLMYELLDHSALITHLAFSPDSKRLASCSQDLAVKFWKAVE